MAKFNAFLVANRGADNEIAQDITVETYSWKPPVKGNVGLAGMKVDGHDVMSRRTKGKGRSEEEGFMAFCTYFLHPVTNIEYFFWTQEIFGKTPMPVGSVEVFMGDHIATQKEEAAARLLEREAANAVTPEPVVEAEEEVMTVEQPTPEPLTEEVKEITSKGRRNRKAA